MPDSTTLPAVATKTYQFCKKCDCERYHVVLAHPTPQSAKIECEVCKRKSTLKLSIGPSGKSRLAAATRSRKTKASQEAPETKWRELLASTNLDNKKPYSMRQSFQTEDAIEHPKFGLGVVTQAAAQQIEVVFESGVKALVHNRS